jgi:hypothetical protein
MNRNLDGTKLTQDQLIQIGLASGDLNDKKVATILGANHSAKRTLSDLHDATRQGRLALFTKGHLTLDTRPDR